MRSVNKIANQQIALMQMRQAVLLCYLQILMSMRRVWETRPTTYTYDEVGNRLTKVPDTPPNTNETVAYGYDDENRLTSVLITANNKTKQLSFAYDPFGRRIAKTLIKDEIGTDCTTPNVCPRTTNYLYDGQSIILEYQNGNITAKYTHGPNIDEPLAVEQGTNTYYYHNDGLGSITALTNAAGEKVQTYSYDSFGNMTQAGTITQPFTYTAREFDTETGMYFYRARYYDSKVGRFVTKDPIGFKGGINVYAYVGNNPIKYRDPSGHMGCSQSNNTNAKGYEVGNFCAAQIKGRIKNPDSCISDKMIFEDCTICCVELSQDLPSSDLVASACLTMCQSTLHALKKNNCCKQ